MLASTVPNASHGGVGELAVNSARESPPSHEVGGGHLHGTADEAVGAVAAGGAGAGWRQGSSRRCSGSSCSRELGQPAARPFALGPAAHAVDAKDRRRIVDSILMQVCDHN